MKYYTDYTTAWADGNTVTIYDEIQEEGLAKIDFNSAEDAGTFLKAWKESAPAGVIAEILDWEETKMTQYEILHRAWLETLRRWNEERARKEELQKRGDPAPIAIYKEHQYRNELQEIEDLIRKEINK